MEKLYVKERISALEKEIIFVLSKDFVLEWVPFRPTKEFFWNNPALIW